MKASELIGLSDVLELMLDAVCVVDRFGHFVFVSAAFENMFGYSPSEVIGQSMERMVFPEDKLKTAKVVETLLNGEVQPRFENRWLHKDGRIVHVLWSARWSEEHQVRIAVAHDITERKIIESRLVYMAAHDQLTGLPNRSFFLERLEGGLLRVNQNESYPSPVVLFVDIDGFKQVNDNYGHGVGDKLLQLIAQRLQHCVGESVCVARQGGDEFLVLLGDDDAKGAEQTKAIAQNAVLEIGKPFNIEGALLHVSASIGLSNSKNHATTVLELIRQADLAMYQAKRLGGNQVAVFETVH
ncbi:Cyclic di-GMP phosphodiesterase Gmr [Marinomonas spartinae]|uniref:diguanylate cyclase domain-containing protein n=1 Tax=Marinomonas spartinae TaxID=1792290 RepID=UPI000808CD73|nr:diguanylate cyclase [Marinomonas spartinae]SBS38682.1 Cyclic di-GMP phosphodiesterase Gmr [Marinomonas spartinae]